MCFQRSRLKGMSQKDLIKYSKHRLKTKSNDVSGHNLRVLKYGADICKLGRKIPTGRLINFIVFLLYCRLTSLRSLCKAVQLNRRFKSVRKDRNPTDGDYLCASASQKTRVLYWFNKFFFVTRQLNLKLACSISLVTKAC